MARTYDPKKKGNGPGLGRPPLAAAQKPKPEAVAIEIEESPEAQSESGRAAFMRIATKRINFVIDRLNTLSKLSSGKSKYGYRDEDVEYIRNALLVAVNKACDRMRRKPLAKGGFSFERRGEDAGA